MADKRNGHVPPTSTDLSEEVMFSYEIKKDNKVFIYWYHKMVKVLSGTNASKFITRMQTADVPTAQRIMAQATGNFKRKKDEGTNTIVIRGAHYVRKTGK